MAATTLNGAINDTVTTITLTDFSGFPIANYSQAWELIAQDGTDIECFRVIDTSAAPDLVVMRAMRGTTAQSWTDGTAVKLRGKAFSVDEQKLNKNASISISDGDKGDITVTSSGTAWTIDNKAVTLAKMNDVATATVFYRKTAGTGVPEVTALSTLKTDLGLTGTNSGDQTSIVGISGTKAQFDTACSDGNFLYTGDITQYTDELAQDAIGAMIDGTLIYTDSTPLLSRAALTGDVTASTGSNATTIANDAVTYAKIQNVSATDKLLGRSSSGAGDVEEIACTAAGRALIDDADAAAQRTTLGLGTLATQSGTFSGTSSGTNTGDQTITLTGDVTGSGTGSFAATIANSAVTLAKQANMATASVVYRKTAGSGAPEVNTVATLKTDLGLTGTNSGDQTSIVGITGTKAEFNTACTDGDFLYTGDVLSFKTIAISGQSDVVADSLTDTLTLVAGTNITLTTNASTDTVTIDAASGTGLTQPQVMARLSVGF